MEKLSKYQTKFLIGLDIHMYGVLSVALTKRPFAIKKPFTELVSEVMVSRIAK